MPLVRLFRARFFLVLLFLKGKSDSSDLLPVRRPREREPYSASSYIHSSVSPMSS